MLQYSAIIREILAAKRALDEAVRRLREDNKHLNDAKTLLSELDRLKMSLERQEANEDEDDDGDDGVHSWGVHSSEEREE